MEIRNSFVLDIAYNLLHTFRHTSRRRKVYVRAAAVNVRIGRVALLSRNPRPTTTPSPRGIGAHARGDFERVDRISWLTRSFRAGRSRVKRPNSCWRKPWNR